VDVLEVDPATRRIRLSRKSVLEAVEEQDLREYTERTEPAKGEAFGSLAEKLKSALKR
jgi:ribosomal protein S1